MPVTLLRTLALPAAFCTFLAPAFGQATATPTDPQRPVTLTVDGINHNPAGTPPQGGTWSPDGHLLSFVAHGGLDGLPEAKDGDIVAVDAATGGMRVLVSAAQIETLSANQVDEQDRDHRDRYHMASYLWAQDGQHLLLDRGGKLYLWDLQSDRSTLVVDTKTESGDDPKFSPDGKTVSYLREHNLYVHPVAGGDEVALTTTPAGTAPDALLNGEVDWLYLEELEARTNYAWAPNSQALAYLQADESKVPQYPIEDYIPTHATVNWQRYPQAGDPNPAVRVGVVPVTGGGTTWLNIPLNAGNDYIPRFGWVDEKTVWVEVLTRDHTKREFFLADAHTGAVHLLHTDADPKYLDDNYGVLFLPGGRFLFSGWADGHRHLYLYRFDPTQPMVTESRLERQLTHGDFEVNDYEVPSQDGHVAEVLFTSTEGSPVEAHLWTVRLDGTGKRELTRAEGVHRALTSPEGRYFTDQSSSLGAAPTVRLCATAEPERCHLLWQSKPVPTVPGVRTSLVQFKAADNSTTLYGRLVEPDGANPAHSVPIILNPYGGPTETAGVQDTWAGAGFDQLLAQHGYAVLHVDNRGSGGRGRTFEQANYRNFGAVQLADQLAALDQQLARDPQLDPQRVGWWGWSWGGFFTLYAMTHSDRIRAGVAVAPGNPNPLLYDSVYTERYLGLPAENEAAYRASNVDLVAGQLKGRLMLAHGTGDDNVHLGQTIGFVQALITAGVPYDLQLFPRLTHSLAGLPARDELYNRILYQFDMYLKPTPPAQP